MESPDNLKANPRGMHYFEQVALTVNHNQQRTERKTREARQEVDYLSVRLNQFENYLREVHGELKNLDLDYVEMCRVATAQTEYIDRVVNVVDQRGQRLDEYDGAITKNNDTIQEIKRYQAQNTANMEAMMRMIEDMKNTMDRSSGQAFSAAP